MIEYDEAARLLFAAVEPLGSEEVDRDRAAGRVLAEPVANDRDSPAMDRSAMDGFAVRSADLTAPGAVLDVVGESRAGLPLDALEVDPGQAVRIMTGAKIPPGADAVVMVEKTRESRATGKVTIDDSPVVGQHIRRRGEDLRAGETVVEAGTPVHAPEIAALSTVGRKTVRVFKTPVVSVLTTGDEIVEPDQTPQDYQVRNSNAPTLLAQLHEMGLRGRYLGIAPDEPSELQRSIREGLSGDLLLITGGVSAGDYDYVGQVLDSTGLERLFYKVAVKPGKPMLAGRCSGTLVIGLPGNPVSTYAMFAVFVAPALRKMAGYRRWRNTEAIAVLEEPLRPDSRRRTYHLARLRYRDGVLSARPAGTRGSGDVLSVARANGFIVTDAGSATFAPGTELEALAWPDFHLR